MPVVPPRWRPTSRRAWTPRWTAPTRRPPQLVRAVDRLLRARRPAPSAGGPGQRRHRRGRRPGTRARRAGHRAVPHRAHVPRRPPGADRAAHPGRHRRRAGRPRWTRCCRCSARTSSSCSRRWTGCRSPSGCSTRRCTSSCPDRTELSVQVALAEARRQPADLDDDERLLAAVERLHESNPMLGLRGVRLGPADARAVRAAGAGDRRGGDATRSRPASTRRSRSWCRWSVR